MEPEWFWDSMLAHVGAMLAPGGLKLAPRWLKIALCWLKLAPRRLKWPLKASQVPQDEAKMAPRWLPNRYVLASWSFLRDLLPGLRFPVFGLFGSFENINFGHFLEQISIIFGSFLASGVVYAPRGLKIPS